MLRRVLVVSPTPTHPPNAGNRARILAMCEALAARGHEVHFVHCERDPSSPEQMAAYWGNRYHPVKYKWPKHPKEKAKTLYDRMIRRAVARWRGEELSDYNWGLDDWYQAPLDPMIDALHREHHFDVVLVVYVFFSRAFLRFGNGVLKLIDAQDVFTDRYKQFLANGEKPVFYSCSARDEARGMKRADWVIAIQEDERRHYAALGANAVTIGHILPIMDLPAKPFDFALLFVGSANSINVASLQWFRDEILPRVHAQYPQARLLIAGKVCEHAPDGDDCVKLGEMPNLEDAYAQADIVVNPRRFGTGLSIKSIEALAYGKPLVATIAGASGMEDGADAAYLLRDDAVGTADAICALFGDAALRARMAAGGRDYARRHNDRNLALLTQLAEGGAPATP